MFFFFCFKQKTAYEMRISDWSSDVCSSDLPEQQRDRPDESVHEELQRRLARAAVSPDRDDEVHGDQRKVPEHVEQEQVQGGEHSQIGRAACRERVCQYV